jgi:Bacterial Ig-like domain (group 3)/MBG domain (YGX type)
VQKPIESVKTMKTNHCKLTMILGSLALLAIAGQAHAAPVFNGEFNMFKPGTTPAYSVTGTFPSAGQYIPGGFGLGLAVGGGVVNFSDSTTGGTVDVPGWKTVRGGGDLYVNGFDGPLTPGFHGGGSWFGQTLIESLDPIGTVAADLDYTISVLVGGPGSPADGPLAGPLELNLLANGVALTPTGSVNVPTPIVAGTWYTISRTYSASSLTSNIGQDLKIQVGVAASNSIGNRVIFDNVSLDTVAADVTPPTLTSIVDNKTGGPVLVNEPVTYTVTFSEPMAAATVNVDDFGNASAAAVTIDSVTPTGDPAVFTVVANASEAGTLQLQINSGATLTDFAANPLVTTSALLDDTAIVVNNLPKTPTTITVGSSNSSSTYGQNVTFTATVSPIPSGGTVQFYNGIDDLGTSVTVNTTTGEASISTSLLGAATHPIAAEYSGNFQFESSNNVLSPFMQEVGKAQLTVTASTVVRQPNTPNPDPFLYQITGYQNGETFATSGVSGAPLLTTDATLSSPVGTYTITCAEGGLAADNYSFLTVNGTLTITNLGCQLGVLNLSANGGINPATGNPWTLGDTYRLIFVTSGTTACDSPDIATYNSYVQGLADAAGLGTSPLGPVTWKVVGSTATVAARDNTGTNPEVNGVGEPIVRMDGLFVIANNYADLWNGIVASHEPGQNFLAVHLDENGVERIDERVRTGSLANGTSSATQMLGTGDVQTGRNYAPNGYGSYGANSWMADWHASGPGRVYAISGVLTIIETTPPGYGAWAATNAPGQTPDQDYDNDGVDNGVEYFMGETGSSFTAMPSLDGSNTIAWTVSAAYQGTYEVQTSPDLVNWTNVDPKPAPSGGTLSYTLPPGAPGGKSFVRLLVTPTP